MKKQMLIFCFLIMFILAGEMSFASTAYVTDSFEITLRSGPSNSNKITLLLKSGQALEVIKEEGQWSNVRFIRKDGTEKEGWVLNRYLIYRLPWQKQAEELGRKNSALKQSLRETEKQRDALLVQKKELEQELKKTTQAVGKIKNQYDSLEKGAATYLSTKKELGKALSELDSANAVVKRQKDEIQKLSMASSLKWFATGAIVILCGWLIGLAMGRQNKKRKSSLLQ